MGATLLARLRRLRSDESGQSLIIMAVAMVVIMGVAALAIDAATWYQKHHQAQVVADAAALAAANCLANPGVGPTGNVCGTSTDVSTAQQVAVNYAASNGVTIPTSNVVVNTTADTVKVTASETSRTFFASLAGIKSTTQTASSTASWTPGVSATCTAQEESAGECWAIYAQNPTCGAGDGWTSSEVSSAINGTVHTQGSLNLSNGTFTFDGPITYSSGNCTYNGYGVSGDQPTAGGNQPSSYWPLDYSTVFPACTTTCTGPGGTPAYCTQAATSFTFTSSNPIASNVYCSTGSGTGVSASNPATWTGSITFNNGPSAGSSSSPLAVTMIAGNIDAVGTGSSFYIQPKVSNCLVYAVDTDAAAGGDAVLFQNGQYHLQGTVFAPSGTIYLTSVSATTAFLEGKNVNTTNLAFEGSGPLASSAGSSSAGSDGLTQ